MILCGAVAGISLIVVATLNHITLQNLAEWLIICSTLVFNALLLPLLGRYCEVAADAWVAHHAPSEAALLRDYFAQQADKLDSWATWLVDPHPAPSQRRRAIAEQLHRSTETQN